MGKTKDSLVEQVEELETQLRKFKGSYLQSMTENKELKERVEINQKNHVDLIQEVTAARDRETVRLYHEIETIKADVTNEVNRRVYTVGKDMDRLKKEVEGFTGPMVAETQRAQKEAALEEVERLKEEVVQLNERIASSEKKYLDSVGNVTDESDRERRSILRQLATTKRLNETLKIELDELRSKPTPAAEFEAAEFKTALRKFLNLGAE